MKVLGPYLNNCNRQFVVIKKEDGGYYTQSYPRYLMEQKLGRPLAPNEDVHHIDENPLNNDPANLEVKIHGPHQAEHAIRKYFDQIKTYDVCGKQFVWTAKQQSCHSRSRFKGRSGIVVCSKSCAGFFGRQEQLNRNVKTECQ